MRPSCTSSGSTPRSSTCPDEKDWTSITALPSRKFWLNLLAILASCADILRPAQPWTVDAILNIPTLADPQIRPDGRQFAYVRRSLDGKVWRNVIFVAPIPAGTAKQIAEGSHPRWSADSRRLAWLRGQVHVDGSAVTHSPIPPVTYSWTPDSAGIAYLAADPGPAPDPIVADRDYRYVRLYIQPLSGGEARRITTADRHVVSFALSPDGTRAVYAAQPTPRNRDSFDCDLYEIDLRTLAERPIVLQPGRDADPSYSPDGKRIAFHSQGGTLNYFAARDVALVPSGGGAIRYLTRDPHIGMDVFRGGNSFSWSPDGETLHYTAGRAMGDFLFRQNVSSGNIERAVHRAASAASFTPDLKRGVFLKPNDDKPPEIVLLEGVSESPLVSVAETVAAYAPVHPREVMWKSRDGLHIEGVLFLPFRYQPGQRVPLLAELHGGPTGVALAQFPMPRTYPTQAFLENGIAVLQPNFRGSSNYGADFRLKNIQSQGFGDFDDVMTGVEMLVRDGIADPNRLGVMGWSYGGFLTAWVIGHTDRFKAASIGAPATDWITYYAQSDGPRSTLLTYFGGTPWDKPESYSRHSPRSGISNIRTPSLLQVGALDINHNNEIYWSLTDRNVPVEYVIYPREPHGFTEPEHQRDVMERNLGWFMRWLR
jgi:dipeptidyl aminopeptidase/acylaminoacyl peptidase